MQDTIWVTREGRHIPVSKMTTSHIKNCVAKILRSRRGWRRQYLERLNLELFIRSLGRGR